MSVKGFTTSTYLSADLGVSGVTYPFSIQAWILADGTTWDISSGDRLVSLDDNTTPNNSEVALQKNLDQMIAVTWSTAPASDAKTYTTGTNEFDDVWVPCFGVWTNDTTRQVYVFDSTKPGTGGSSNQRIINTLDTVALGATTGPGNYLINIDGLAEVAIWDVALLPGELDLLGAGSAASSIQASNLISYWTLLDASTGKTDLGTAGVDLTENGTLTWASGTHPTIANITSVSTDDKIGPTETNWVIAGSGFGAD